MSTTSSKREFSFGDDSVARAYDNFLVPYFFTSWAKRIIEDYQPWTGKHVLDLAAGTGIVTSHIANHVGSDGHVTAVDINSQMLELAKNRCAGASADVKFCVSAAESMDISSDSIDVVICQQGFQFFPSKDRAAAEIHRVLRPGGQIVVSTWLPVSECEFFGAICQALDDMGESDISSMMRIPFDYMSAEELATPFESAGFVNVKVSKESEVVIFPGGFERAIELSYASPIGPKLKTLSSNRQELYASNLKSYLNALSPDGKTYGRMTTNVLSASK